MLEPAFAARPPLAVLVLAVALTGAGAIAWPDRLELEVSAGLVAPESIVETSTGVVWFTMHQMVPKHRIVAVRHDGTLPDAAYGCRKVIVKGRMAKDHFFEAVEVLGVEDSKCQRRLAVYE